MSSTTTSQAMTKRSIDSTLMPPPPRPKRIKRPAKVLDEDTYTNALSHIIARDFFPGLIETESQQEYLNALDSQDNEWIATAGRRLTEVMTPGPDGRKFKGRRGTSMTPTGGLHGLGSETPKAWQGDTPSSTMSTKDPSDEENRPAADTNMSLGAFQSKYTSEDNESFYRLLDKQNIKRSEKHAWMWAGNKIPAARQIAHHKREEQKLLTAGKKPSIAEVDGKEVALIRPDEDDTRQAMPDSWKSSAPDNGFMFTPSSVEDSLQTVAQRAEESSKAPPKAVIYDNTRLAALSTSTADSESIPPSPSLSAVQDALAGQPRPTASEAAIGGGRTTTPRVNGYAFVDSEEPSPPSPIQQSSLTLLGSGDKNPNPFNIKEKSKREDLHHRMVDKVAKGKRVKSLLENVKTPVPRFMSSPRIAKAGLTPAGQRLLGRFGADGGARTSGVWGREEKPKGSLLRGGWTPRG
ncbi:MAG: hypothetical protein Q9216_002211 [Gyalolechia sp. 2 TL-2023]